MYHCAGLTSVRPADAARLFEVNVGGTRTVLEECLRAGAERVVHLSSAAAFGPAPAGGVVDERRRFDASGLGIPYVASVYQAEVEALRLHATELLMLLGTAIVLVVERPVAAPAPVTAHADVAATLPEPPLAVNAAAAPAPQ